MNVPTVPQLFAMLKLHCRMARAFASEGALAQCRRAEKMARECERAINARVQS